MSSAPYSSELAEALAPDVLDRLLRYVRIDTQSDRAHAQSPSTPGQLELGRLLVEELRGIGLDDAALDANGFVTATLPGNARGAPVIGLLAHLDTSPDESGAGVEPLVHRAYDGGTIALPRRGHRARPGADAGADRQGRARSRDHQRRHAARRRRQGGDGRGHGRGRVPRRAPRAATSHRASRLHARRGDRRGSQAVRHRALRRGVRVHARRLGGGGVHRRDVHRRVGRPDDPRRRHPPGHATGKLVNAARLAGRVRRRAAAGPAHAGDDRRSRRLHPRAPARGHRGHGDDPHDRARLRRRPARGARRAAAPHRRGGRRDGAARATRGRGQGPVSEHAQLPRAPSGGLGCGRGGAAPRGLRAAPGAARGGTDGSILSARGLPTPNLFTGGHEYHSVASGHPCTTWRRPRRSRCGSPACGPSARADRRWARAALRAGGCRGRAERPARPRAPVGPAAAPGGDGRLLCRPGGRAAPGVRLPAADARPRGGGGRSARGARRRRRLRAGAGAGGGRAGTPAGGDRARPGGGRAGARTPRAASRAGPPGAGGRWARRAGGPAGRRRPTPC